MDKLHLSLFAACAIALAGCQSMEGKPALRRMDVNGVQLAYVDQGSGVPIVFVHPALLDHRIWDSQRESFSKTHRFIAYDQRYFGTSPWPDKGERFSKDTQVADLIAFIRGLKAGPVHLVGWSMSADTVLIVALRHPELVRSAFSYEPGGGIEVADPAAAKKVSDDAAIAFGPAAAAHKAGDAVAATKALIEGVEDKPGAFDAAPPAVRALWMDNARTVAPMMSTPNPPPLTCDQLAQLKVPVAIASGGLARPFFAITTDTAARCIARATRVVAPKEHHIWPANDPRSFEVAVRGFIQGK